MSIVNNKTFYILILICFVTSIVSQPKIIIIEKVEDNNPRGHQDNEPWNKGHKKDQPFEEKGRLPQHIKDQIEKDRQKNQFYHPPSNQGMFKPPNFQREEAFKAMARNCMIKWVLFGVGMFFLGVFVVGVLYVAVTYYNRWLQNKQKMFYNHLTYLRPKETNLNEINNQSINNDNDIVPNASQDVFLEMSKVNKNEKKMYTNSDIMEINDKM